MKKPGEKAEKRGRKPKPEGERRDNVVVRFSAIERALVDDAAGPKKGARSAFIRAAAMARARRTLKARE